MVTDKDVIAQLSEASPYAHCAKEAPLVFVPCYREQGIAPEYFDIDMSVAVENMLLQQMRLAWMLCGWALRRIKREWMRCVKC